jgi:hypothetical protein
MSVTKFHWRDTPARGMLKLGCVPVVAGNEGGGPMTVLVMYVGYAVAPAAVLYIAVRVTRRLVKRSSSPRRPAAPLGRDLLRLVDDLHRLEHEYSRIERSDSPAKAARLRAVNLAYDDTLRECCLALGLPEPGERPLSGLLRLQTEAELAQHGLVW